MTSDISKSIKGASVEDAQLSSVLMVGSARDPDFRLISRDRSILSRFLKNIDVLGLPVGEVLSRFKEPAYSEAAQGTVKTIDINKEQGGVDFFSFNQGDRPPEAIILSGVPRYPQDNAQFFESVSEMEGMSALFSHSTYHHNEDDWYNFRKKVQELSPNVIFCAGGDDCLSWQEIIGPGYIAIYGEGMECGMLISHTYLKNIEAYLMIVDSPLLEPSIGSVLVYHAALQAGSKSFSLSPEASYNYTPLWPPHL